MKKLVTEHPQIFNSWPARSSDNLQLMLWFYKSHGISDIPLTVACFVAFMISQIASAKNKQTQYLVTPADGSEILIFHIRIIPLTQLQ